jgi:hypothetical protein
MAKFNSLVYSEIRGSVNGLTYSRNGNSAYVRSKATPVNPRTAGQTAARDSLNYVSSAWRGLTAGQRSAWNALAATVPYTNSIGNVSYYSGFQLFMKNNLTLLGAGATLISDAVAAPSFPSVELSAFTATASTGIITMNAAYPSGSASGFNLVVEGTAPFSAGKSFVAKNQYGFLDGLGDPDDGAIVTTTPYAAKYGAITAKAGMKISQRVRFVDFVSGFSSPYVEIATIIV